MSKSCLLGDTQTLRTRKASLFDQGAKIESVHEILTPLESQYLIDAAERSGTCKRSKVVGKDKTTEHSDARTSTTCFIKKGDDEVIACIEKKIAQVADQPVETLEPLQITRYRQGQQYKPHFDFFTTSWKPGERQRVKTLFTYLNDVQEGCGGATVFSECKVGDGEPLRVQPSAGTGVLWDNVHPDGTGNKMTRHGGEPVTCDVEKIGLNAWFGDRPW